jgi:YHS domain-containing protein
MHLPKLKICGIAFAVCVMGFYGTQAQTSSHAGHDHSKMDKGNVTSDTTSDTMHAKPESELKPQQTCPVMSEKINKKLYVDYQGQRIYVCCGSCKAEVKKNPQKYIDKLAMMGEKTETVPVTTKDKVKK